MGGELQACGCFDGPYSEEDATFVSIRCADHLEQAGAGLQMIRTANGHAVPVNDLLRAFATAGAGQPRRKMAASVKTRRRGKTRRR